MTTLIVQLHDAFGIYRQFVTAASTHVGPIDRLGLFGYRTGALESEVIEPQAGTCKTLARSVAR